ncbi:hypothetical protein PO909_025246 [Leuciscus waleckii]
MRPEQVTGEVKKRQVTLLKKKQAKKNDANLSAKPAKTTCMKMDFNSQFQREPTGELTPALAAVYRRNPTPGHSWPARRRPSLVCQRKEVTHQVTSSSALQFGQYRGKTLKWWLSSDIVNASMVLAVHQREREGGDTTQSAIMGNKDALLRYAALFPDMMAAIS